MTSKSRSTSGFGGTRRYCRLGPMDFSNFFIPYVFHVKESIFRSITKLPCFDDLENPSQLPVLQKPEGTEDWVLWIFVFSSFPTYSRSRNQFFAVSQSYHVRVNSKIQVNFREKLEGTDDWVLWIIVISSFPTFSGSGKPHDTIRHDTMRYDTTRQDKMRYDTIRYDTIR